LREMVIVTVVADLEGIINCVVGVGAAHREQEFREFLAKQGSELEKPIARTCSLGDLMRFACKRVSFKDRAKRLLRISHVLFDTDPWPDEDTRRYLLDLIRVRNIIVHAGGWPSKEHAADVETPAVIVQSNTFFWKLELDEFMGPGLGAAATPVC